MQKMIFSFFILTALFFVVHSQVDSNTTLSTTTQTNNTITVSSDSVKIVVKCRDTNSILNVINLDTSGSTAMSNIEQSDENTGATPIFIVFEKCHTRTNNLLSLFKSYSSMTANNDSLFDFPQMSFVKNFRIKITNQTRVDQMPGNETTLMV